VSITISQSVASLQYVRVGIKATVNGSSSYNPTSDPVSFAFLPQATNPPTTVPSSWVSGIWETDVQGGLTVYVARCLVGPGGTFVPTANTAYWVWVKVSDSPETPVLGDGDIQLKIT